MKNWEKKILTHEKTGEKSWKTGGGVFNQK